MMQKQHKLTIKQEKFSQAYVKTGNASEAYRQAYDAEHMTPPAINQEAHHLARNPNIALRVEELTELALATSQVTPEWIVERLCATHNAAIAARPQQLAAANRSLELLGRFQGMFRDADIGTTVVPITKVTVVLPSGSDTEQPIVESDAITIAETVVDVPSVDAQPDSVHPGTWSRDDANDRHS
jgi:phage terminase small subunit